MKQVQIKFKGIDDFNRPVYKIPEVNFYIGSTTKLFSWTATEEEVNDYFKDRLNELVFFGDKFNCEPMGSEFKEDIELVIIK